MSSMCDLLKRFSDLSELLLLLRLGPHLLLRLGPHPQALWISLTGRRRIRRGLQICAAPAALADRSFEADAQQLLGLDGELHRQLAEDFLAEAADDHVDGV